MTEPVNAPDPARLDELAAVTKEYARYSSERSGLACSTVGAWWLAVFAIALCAPAWGRIAALWSPVVAIGFVVAGRRYYQRFGQVLSVESSPPGAPWKWRKSVRLTAFLMAIVVVDLALNLDAWSGGSPIRKLALVGVLATAPAVPLLVDRKVVGFWDGGLVFFSVALAQMTASLTHDDRFGWMIAYLWQGLIAAFGVAAVGLGIHHHLQYRRLERRLAALKGRA